MQIAPFDCETLPIMKGFVYPPMVCVQARHPEAGSMISSIKENRQLTHDICKGMLEGPFLMMGVNTQYDLHVIRNEFPELEPLIEAKLARREIVDLGIVHDLCALGEWGSLSWTPFPELERRRIGHGMSILEGWYLGDDPERLASKKDADSVRTRYHEVAHLPVAEWPEAFVKYALEDVDYPALIWAEIVKRPSFNERLLNCATDRTATHYFLGHITERGMRTDAEYTQTLRAEVDEELDPKHYGMLTGTGFLVPATGPMPYAGDARSHTDKCKKPKIACTCPKNLQTVLKADLKEPARIGGDWSEQAKLFDVFRGRRTEELDPEQQLEKHGLLVPNIGGRALHLNDCPTVHKAFACECPPKMKKPQKESFGDKLFRGYVLEYCRQTGKDIKLTKGGVDKFELKYGERAFSVGATSKAMQEHPEWVSTDGQTIAELNEEKEDPVFNEYQRRSATIKLRTDYLNKMFDEDDNVHGRMHFNYRAIVSTGRTGSYGGSFYPSMNGQNIDPRVRLCFIADEGRLIISTDYGSLELRSAAWRCEMLGIPSMLAKLYREGGDPHSFLAAALAWNLGGNGNPPGFDGTYESFLSFKSSEKWGKWFKLWRKFSKVVGLGCWGAMGPRTMLNSAHSPVYDLQHVTLEMCEQGIEIWKQAFPEAVPYFEHVRTDLRDIPFCKIDPETGRQKDRYFFESPFGLKRRNVAWTEASNGDALQPPSADGASVMLQRVISWTRQPEIDVNVLGFLHDELLYDIPIGHDYYRIAVENLMCESMSEVLTGIPMEVESAAMIRWDKFAPELYDPENGALTCKDITPNAVPKHQLQIAS